MGQPKDFSERVKKVDDRTIVLVKKYPLVAATVFMLGVAIGAILMAVLI